MQVKKGPTAPPEFREGSIEKMDASALIGVLKNPELSEFQKAKAGQRLGEVASKEAVPSLASMLGDPHLSVYARHGLETVKDPSADDALRGAMGKLKGNPLIGVINSLGKRRDAKARPALLKLMYGPDADVARASASALGKIGGATTAQELRAAYAKTTGMVKMAVADACLVCADGLLAEGKRDEAMKLWASLSGPEVAKPVRLAAMQSIIREETSVSRPR